MPCQLYSRCTPSLGVSKRVGVPKLCIIHDPIHTAAMRLIARMMPSISLTCRKSRHCGYRTLRHSETFQHNRGKQSKDMLSNSLHISEMLAALLSCARSVVLP